MNSIITTIVGTFITVVITAVTGFFISSMDMKDGKIGFEDRIIIKGTEYSIIKIENSSNKTLNNLKINIPSSIKLVDIITSVPVDILLNDNMTHKNTINQITINNLPDNRVIKILLPFQNNKPSIEIMNHESLNLEFNNPSVIDNPYLESLVHGGIMAFSYFIVFSFFSYFEYRSVQRRKEEWEKKIETYKLKLKETNDELARINQNHIDTIKQHEEITNKTKELSKDNQKLKLLLLTRMTDYAKELTFWRDTIRKIMYDANKKNVDSEMIIDTVTKNLKTYSTKNEKNVDFATLMLLEKLNKK